MYLDGFTLAPFCAYKLLEILNLLIIELKKLPIDLNFPILQPTVLCLAQDPAAAVAPVPRPSPHVASAAKRADARKTSVVNVNPSRKSCVRASATTKLGKSFR